MKSLITGGAGFVGSHIAERLINGGYGVIVLDNLFSGSMDNIHLLEKLAKEKGVPFEFHETDIREIDRTARAFGKEVDSIFHLAAIVSVPYSMDHKKETEDVNVGGTENMLALANDFGVKRFVNAGSAAEYGNEERLPVKEKYAKEGVQLSPYGETKFKASWLTADAKSNGRYSSLRPFNIYGPRQDPKSPYSGVISIFIDKSREGVSLPILGDGSQTRDFIFVDDMVGAYLAAAGYDPDSEKIVVCQPAISMDVDYPIFNVGTGKRVTIRELAETINHIAESKGGIDYKEKREGDIVHSVADISKAVRHLGWKPEIGLRKGLEETVSYFTK
ncbi:MAG: NAD-dependent epimerase/dehydratase family protein [Nanoarchaeota archaeon]